VNLGAKMARFFELNHHWFVLGANYAIYFAYFALLGLRATQKMAK
jgi:hypothetical protein